MTKSETAAADIAALLRARYPLLLIVTGEEGRVERYAFEAAASAGYTARFWDVSAGCTDLAGKPLNIGDRDPENMLQVIQSRASGDDRGVWILRDLKPWLEGLPGATVSRRLRNLARYLPTVSRQGAQAIIMISPSRDLPPEIAPHATVIEWPLPDRAEIEAILDAAIAALPEEIKQGAVLNGSRGAAIDAAVGLSGEETAACYARSLVQYRRIDPVAVAGEKKRIIAKAGLLEWIDPIPAGLSAVGGLDLLKEWLLARASAWSIDARAYGLPSPKGCLLVGVPGGGKSYTAKAIGSQWGIPILRVDLGALKSKYVGESEQNLRRVFALIEAIGRCIVWLDEIEKSLAGGAPGASADGGVASDALGAILSWMQERKNEAFVIATANDVRALPPELLRKGRFDELWFVDLPTTDERAAIVRATLKQFGKGATVDLEAISAATSGFVGAELAAIVPEAMFPAFKDNARDVTTADLLSAAKSVVPLSKTAAPKIEALRQWARENARPASRGQSPETTGPAPRTIDI